jgi:tryptophan halogenase
MEGDRRIRRIAIVGGGTAGWIAASLLANRLRGTCAIDVIESPDIPTIGVGEATVPGILTFLKTLGIDQNDFMEHTQGAIKLAIRFKDWKRLGEEYWHPFGAIGATIERLPFYQFWHKARTLGHEPQMGQYNLEVALAQVNRFIYPGNSLGIAQGLRYALHFDAGLMAKYLRVYSEALGVRRHERNVAGASLRADGFIEEVVFVEGDRLKADLYIDCTGFRGLLIEQALATGYRDWSDVLPCNRAVAMQVPNQIPRPPYTSSTARAAGWQWRIPLQHRVGTGYVYSSQHISDEDALADLLAVPGNTPLVEPRFIRFVTGHRKLFWNRNCVALGLASGFIEPLESTSIHLIYSGVYNLLDHFPDSSFDPVNIADYNAQMVEEFERVRDFIVLHYCTTQRTDTPLWQHCQRMAIPDTLAERLEMYRRTGRIYNKRYDLFTELSWFAVLDGMGVRPRDYDPLVDCYDFGQVERVMQGVRQKIAAEVAQAPSHDSFFRATAREDITPASGWQRVGAQSA